jgi:hypothetical protein
MAIPLGSLTSGSWTLPDGTPRGSSELYVAKTLGI